MKAYLIPAETVEFSEEIKERAVLLHLLLILKGLRLPKRISNQLKRSFPMLGIIVGHLLLEDLMIHNS